MEKHYVYKGLVKGRPYSIKECTDHQGRKMLVDSFDHNVTEIDMNQVRYIVEVDTIKCGQQRPYGDLYYEYNIQLHSKEGIILNDISIVEEAISLIIDGSYYERNMVGKWWLGKSEITYDKTIGKWHYAYTVPYLD